jgi:hypothetical protein
MDLTIVAYATLALSLFVSAVKMGGWILNADPRAIINSGDGRWWRLRRSRWAFWYGSSPPVAGHRR